MFLTVPLSCHYCVSMSFLIHISGTEVVLVTRIGYLNVNLCMYKLPRRQKKVGICNPKDPTKSPKEGISKMNRLFPVPDCTPCSLP